MIKILVADDHMILREGLKRIIKEASDIVVEGEASNSREVLQEVRKSDYNVILLDISMPGISGIDILDEIKELRPSIGILMLSTFPEEQYALRSMKMGAAGYLTKESAPDKLIEAIRKVASGGKYISSSLAESMFQHVDSGPEKVPHERLSRREYQVMCMVASGKTVSQIAEELCLSVKTISTNRTRIMEKMDLKSNAELTAYALKNHLVE